MRIHPV